jgi:hypothetical protein
MAKQAREGVHRGLEAGRPFRVPNPERDVGERVESASQPRVFPQAPLT